MQRGNGPEAGQKLPAEMTSTDPELHLSQQLCSNCDTSLSKFWCLDCNGSLCDDCELAHRRVSLTRSHRLRNQPQSVTPTLLTPVKYCRLHMSEPLELYCFTCQQFTCKDCQLTAHRSHSYEFVPKALVVVRKQLEACVQPVMARKDTLKHTMRDMETRLEFIQGNKTLLRKNLTTCYFAVVQSLKNRVSKIFQDVLEAFKLETDHIDNRIKQLKLLQQKRVTLMQTSEKCQSITDLQTLLNLKEQIESQVKEILDEDLSPPPTMSHIKVSSSLKAFEAVTNTFQVEVSWIPFSVSQSCNPKTHSRPADSHPTPPTTCPSHASLSTHKPAGSSHRSSVCDPSSCTSPCPSCKNLPQSTASSLPVGGLHAGSSFTSPSTSSSLRDILSSTQTAVSSQMTVPSQTAVPGPSSLLVGPPNATPALPAPAPAACSQMQLMSNSVPHSHLSEQQKPLPPAKPAGSSQNQLPVVPQSALPATNPPLVCLTNIWTPPTVLMPTFTQSTWIPQSAGLPLHSPVLNPGHPSQPPPEQRPPCQSQAPVAAFSVGPQIPSPQNLSGKQLNQVGGAILQEFGLLTPIHQTLPVTGNFVSLGSSTFLQQTPMNADSVTLGSGPSSQQNYVSRIRVHRLSQPIPSVLQKPARNEPTTTTVERTEPAVDEPTSTLSDDTDSAENKPTSTTADNTDPSEDEPTTTTSVEEDTKLITSTSEDIEFEETPKTSNTTEEQSSPVVGLQHFIDQWEVSGVDQRERSKVRQRERSIVDQREDSVNDRQRSKADKRWRASVDQRDHSSFVQRGGSSVDIRRRSKFGKRTRSIVDQREGSSIDERQRSKVDKRQRSIVDQQEDSQAEERQRSKVDKRQRSIVDQQEDSQAEERQRSKVDKRQRSIVDQQEDSQAEERQRSTVGRRQLRLSLFRLPISPPARGSSLPSFRLVRGDADDEIYLKKMTDSPTEAVPDDMFSFAESPTNALSDDTFDFTEPLTEADADTMFDFTEPLSSPESDLSVEILSCSVCVSSDSLIICSACARGYHRDCHIPPMGLDVKSGWICSLCQDLSDPRDPYSADRPWGPQGPRLGLQDQRRCETLLLFLKVEGCSRLTEFAGWSVLEPVSERLLLRLEPPYETTVSFVSDVWAVFRNAPWDDALKDLQQSFRKKLQEVLGRELPVLVMVVQPGPEEEVQPESGSKLDHIKKKLKHFMDSKRHEKTT
ncbi:transcription intermediary factor 1-beta isoform X3 [Salarias fasciatus]|uniref:transcription intermediary factor 1-beta isoform X2 n=1 Tax=Salarias fasciatus TaxID=181472 RepID=UPI001176B8A4|nr:transcription intermediary factor 1-beta-like isoform X2 [Salarias fasciatus]XP_029957730.1 transcription intermediary factor 1-beta-like isoform X3 [Salarias fasciatus]